MNTVLPAKNAVVSDVTGLRKLQASARQIAKHICLRYKLLGREDIEMNPTSFLLHQAGRKIETVLAGGIPAKQFVYVPSLWDIAKHLGRIKTLEMKTPHFV